MLHDLFMGYAVFFWACDAMTNGVAVVVGIDFPRHDVLIEESLCECLFEWNYALE